MTGLSFFTKAVFSSNAYANLLMASKGFVSQQRVKKAPG
jgi:hypothetical protein